MAAPNFSCTSHFANITVLAPKEWDIKRPMDKIDNASIQIINLVAFSTHLIMVN